MNKPRTLSDVLADYAKTEEMATKDLDSVTPTTRSAFGSAIRQAKDKLPQLRLEYLTAILKNSVGFFVVGDDAKALQFVKIAVDNGAISVDAAAIFNQLADRVQPSIGGRREFSVTQTSLLDSALKELVEHTGYEGRLARTVLADLRVVSTRESLVRYIQELVFRTNGSTPTVVAVQADALKQAMKAKFAGKRLVVVLRNVSSFDRSALAGIFTNTANVNVDSVDEVDEKFARETIKGVLKSVSKPAPTPEKAPDETAPAE